MGSQWDRPNFLHFESIEGIEAELVFSQEAGRESKRFWRACVGGIDFARDIGMTWLLWALLSAVFAGLTAVLAKVGVAGVDSNLATAVRTTVVLVFAWGVALAASPAHALAGFSRRTWLFLVLSGMATGASWLCYFRALQLGEASKVAPIDKLSVVFVLAFAALFLGEALTWRTALGGGLITAGALVLAWK